VSKITWGDGSATPLPDTRDVHLTRASEITPRPVRWAWADRLATGTLALIGGREGIGKSIVAYTLAALITRGRLPGVYVGTPRAVIVAASEDSWAHTIIPRLMAAGADLTFVYRVDVVTSAGADGSLSLPRDLEALERTISEVRAAAILLDPLLSRLDAALDSHKDAEVRLALEPLTAVAERRDCLVIGLIHVNKSTSSDPLTQLMASRAFAAVARAVLFVMTDPENEKIRLLGQAKNNLGRMDLPTLSFQIEGVKVADTTEGEVWTGKLNWIGEDQRSIREAAQAAAEIGGVNRTALGEATAWLEDYLTSNGGSADSADIKREGAKAGHGKDALQRARVKLKIAAISVGFPRRTHWALQSSQLAGETTTTTTTATTDANQPIQSSQSLLSSQLTDTPRVSATTVATEVPNGRF
jgi:AAA domain-containing protein